MRIQNNLNIRPNTVACLGAVILCLMIWPLRASEPSSEQNQALNWSQAQIQEKIRELEAERIARLSLIHIEEPDMSVETLLANPQNWVIGLAILLAISMVCLCTLALKIQRMEKAKHPGGHPGRHPLPNHQGHKKDFPPKNIPWTTTANRVFRLWGTCLDPIEYECMATTGQTNPPDMRPTMPPNMPPNMPPEKFGELDPGPASSASIEVHEETMPLHQAQFWATLNKPDIAIDILEQTCTTDSSPDSWLLLLNLYLKNRHYRKYEALQPHLQSRFNVHVPAWQDRLKPQFEPHLSDMPELAQRINRILPSKMATLYLNDLLFDNRNGTRHGFDYSIYCDLVNLFNAACEGRILADCTEPM